jgi:proline iminopeptidase
VLVDVDGAELCVEADGSSDAVTVLVPSGAGSAFYRNTFSAGLTTSLRFVYVDMRGTGRSTGCVDDTTTFASLADDLDRVRAALGLERVAVLGHSNHGCIALEYALRHPERALAAVSVGSVPDFRDAFGIGTRRWEADSPPPARADLARRMADFESCDVSAMDRDEQWVRRYVSMAPLAWHDAQIDRWAVWDGVPRGAAAYIDWMVSHAQTWNLVPRLAEITVPVLALCGRYDYLCPVELWEGAIDRLPAGRLVVFEESGHNPQLEQQEAFDHALLAFLAEHAS